MKECAICGEKLDQHAIKCSKGHSLFRPPRGRKIYRHTAIKLQSRLGRILGLVFILLFSVPGIITMCTSPSILTCRYVETKQVDCQLQERIAWVIPVREIPITHLKRAYVDYAEEVTESREDEDRRSTVSGVILVSASGEKIEFGHFKEIGSASERTSRRINDFLNAPTDESLTVWRVSWIWMLAVGCFSSVSVLILVALYGEWIKDIVDTVIELYQKVKRERSRKD